MTLADRIEELRALAVDVGLEELVGDQMQPEMLAQAYAAALGIDQWLVLDPTIALEDIIELTPRS